MGLIQEEKERGIFMKISNGKINYSVTKDVIGAVAVQYEDSKTGENKVSYKKEIPGLLGNIIGLKYRDSDYGRNLEIRVRNGDELAILQFKTDSDLHHAVVNLMMSEEFNINENVEITARKYEKTSNGKTFTKNYVGFQQNGVKIKPRHTKETADGPDPIVKDVAGKKKWDWSPVEDYYYNVVIDQLIPQLENVTEYTTAQEAVESVSVEKKAPVVEKEIKVTGTSTNFAPKTEKEVPKSDVIKEEDDDLPF